MSFRQKVIVGFYWTGGARIAGQILTWAITLYVIRLLTPGDYGLLAMATVFASFLTLMGEAGLGAAIVQAPAVDDQKLRGIFAAVILVDTVLFAVQYAAAPAIAWFFGEERLTAIIRVLSLPFLISMFSVIPMSMLARALDFKRPSIIGLVSSVLGSVSTLLLAQNGYGVWALVIGNVITQFCVTAGAIMVAPFLRWPDFSMKGTRGLIVFGGQFTSARLLWFFYSQADMLIAGKLLGRELLGFYSVAMHLASLPVQKISAVINQVTFPAFAHTQHDGATVSQYLLKAVRLLSFFAFPVLWGISSVSSEVVAVVLGDKWQSAALPLRLLPLVMPLSMLSPFLNSAFQGLGRGGVVFRNVLTAASIMPLAFVVGVQWDLTGLALAWVFCFPLVFALNLRRMLPLVGLDFPRFFRAMAPSVVAAAVMYAAVAVTREMFGSGPSPLLVLASLVAIGAAAYALGVLAVNRDGLIEIRDLVARRQPRT